MKFIELTVHTTTEASEIIADIMWNYTNYGVTICDVNDIIALQKSKDTMYWDYMDDDLTAAQPKDVLVKCYIAEDIAEKTVGEIMRDVAEAKEMSGGAFPECGGHSLSRADFCTGHCRLCGGAAEIGRAHV